MTRRILILGGTTEARQLAERLAGRPDLEVTVSLAGRTAAIVAHPVPLRVGGFGGADGLAEYLQRERVDLLVDATHPYAEIISRNAIAAANAANLPLLALRRRPWEPVAGDRWTVVADADAAIAAIGADPRRVFLALGRQEVAAFEAAPQHAYLIRSIDPVEPPLALPNAVYLVARGPFDEGEERALLARHGIEVIVCRNSGGTAAYGKIAAARVLGIAVIMLGRPELAEAPAVATVEEAVAWIDHGVASAVARGV
jgi:precorrin-6A/cobalt-precorrin-6A reductase